MTWEGLLAAAASVVTVGAAIYGVARWAKRKTIAGPEPVPTGSKRKGGFDVELIPLWFELKLGQPIPGIDVWFQCVNYTRKNLRDIRVRVLAIHVQGHQGIENIESVFEWHIEPRGSRQLLCRRALTDLEAKALGDLNPGTVLPATARARVTAVSGRKNVEGSLSLPFGLSGWRN